MTIENEQAHKSTKLDKPNEENSIDSESNKAEYAGTNADPQIELKDVEIPPANTEKDNQISSKDVYLSQANEQVGDGKQENKTNFYINNGDIATAGGLMLTVTQLNTQKEREKSFFDELEKKDYLTNLNITVRSYLEYVADKYFRQFYADRIILINNTTGQETQSMAEVELLMSNEKSTSGVDFFTHNLSDSTFRLQQVIYDFKEKDKDKTGTHFLILNNSHSDFTKSYNRIESILNQSAEQNSVIKMLRESHSYLIIFTKNIEWHGKSVKTDCSLPIISINTIHQQVWNLVSHKEQYEALIPSIEVALADYSWLSETTNDQKVRIITEHFAANSLECIIQEYIEKCTNKELNAINSLIKEPINKIALFNGAYFSGASIDEQNAIINAVIENSVSGDEKNALSNSWKSKADDIMTTCGLTVIEDEYKNESYGFITEVRRENLLTLFQKNYKIFLQINCDAIIRHFLYDSKLLSAAFVEGLCELIFVARNDNGLYLKRECLQMVDILENEDKKEEELKILFARLVFIIEKWQMHTRNKIYLPQFYELLLKTEFKRSIFGAILTYICNDAYPENLDFLKLFLEESKKDDDLAKSKIIRTIAIYFQDNYTIFFQKIIKWNIKEIYSKNVPESFMQVYTAITLHIYNNRFGNKEENQLDYSIVRSYLKNEDSDFILNLGHFLFPKNGLAILDNISRHNLEKQSIKESIIDKLQISLLYYLWAIVIIRIAYLCRKINAGYNLRPIISVFLKTLTFNNYELTNIKNGFRDAIKHFNSKLREETNSEKPDNQIRLTCRTSIDLAKEIIEIIKTNNA